MPAEYKKIFNGTTQWFKDAKCTILHRDDGPAIIYADGTREWHLNGMLHREDGPAYISPRGTLVWRLNGMRHREDGPAVIGANGNRHWYINGKEYRDKKEYQKAANLSDEDMTIILLRYNFT